jgi:hypothetical protein
MTRMNRKQELVQHLVDRCANEIASYLTTGQLIAFRLQFRGGAKMLVFKGLEANFYDEAMTVNLNPQEFSEEELEVYIDQVEKKQIELVYDRELQGTLAKNLKWLFSREMFTQEQESVFKVGAYWDEIEVLTDSGEEEERRVLNLVALNSFNQGLSIHGSILGYSEGFQEAKKRLKWLLKALGDLQEWLNEQDEMNLKS